VRQVLVFLVGLAVLVTGIALASSPVDHGGQTALREIVISDMRFTPSRIDAPAGQTLNLRLENRGLQDHDLNLGSIHMAGLEGAQAILKPGEVRTLTLRFDQPGTHVFTCSHPGHAGAGMTGAVFVHD
jgi:nitrite reductase (NO-forming)